MAAFTCRTAFPAALEPLFGRDPAQDELMTPDLDVTGQGIHAVDWVRRHTMPMTAARRVDRL